MEKYKVKLTFTEPLLGTAPANPEIYTEFIGSNAPDGIVPEDEIESLDDVNELIDKGTTVFLRVDDQPCLWDYQIKGFFKDACGMLRRDGQSRSTKLTAYKKVIDGLLFVFPRQIPLDLNGGELGILERPLRAQTARGERVALARSEMAPAGTELTFQVLVISSVPKTLLEEWLTYGALRGLGQWRNGGYGRFEYEIEKL